LTSQDRQPVGDLLDNIRYRVGQALCAVTFQLLQRVPGVRQRFWKVFYNNGAAQIADERCTFVNWGYLKEGEQRAEGAQPGNGLADSADLLERVSTGLYEQALGDIPIDGRSVLEVGSGRGGGCVHLIETHEPTSVTGVDASDRLVAWCRSNHSHERLRFAQGFASNLPIASASVDVVLCIESSHCYPSRLEFFREVARVLRPGGDFALADFIWPNAEVRGAEDIERLLSEAGITVRAASLITPGVLAARRALSRSRTFRERLPALAGGMLQGRSVLDAWALEGTPYFAALAAGNLEYWSWTGRKGGA